MQLLRRMQALLAQLYDAPVREDVQDFVLSDRRRLCEAVGEQAGEGADEQVFVELVWHTVAVMRHEGVHKSEIILHPHVVPDLDPVQRRQWRCRRDR